MYPTNIIMLFEVVLKFKKFSVQKMIIVNSVFKNINHFDSGHYYVKPRTVILNLFQRRSMIYDRVYSL